MAFPWGGPVATAAPTDGPTDLRTLQFPAAWFAFGVIVTLLVGNFVVTATSHDKVLSAWISLAVLAFYAVGLPMSARYASRRWGSGRISHDLGFRFRWMDLLVGIGGALAMLVTIVVVGAIIRSAGVPQRSNLDEVTHSNRSIGLFIFLVAQAGILAPFVEELLFRGVLFRGLRAKLRWVPALLVQAAIFGMAHVSLDGGWGNVGLAITLACVGLELGLLARSTRRLGAGMIAHGLFNTAQIVLLFFVTLR